MRWITFSLLLTIFATLMVFTSAVEKANAPVDVPQPPQQTEETTEATSTEETFMKGEGPSEPTEVKKPPQEKSPAKETPIANAPEEKESGKEIPRIQNPYPFLPLSGDALNTTARASLVNIICTITSDTIHSVTGSGVVIDPRGIILTNAHVGQYVLLSEVAKHISCVGRTGAPARPTWKLRVMYMPSTWINEHAADLRRERPTGTGEHDYALLLAEPLTTDSPPVVGLPSVAIDTREGIAYEGDEVLLAGYPAGFLGTFTAEHNLHPATTITQIGVFYTFTEKLVDLLSLGGVIVAQGGSSGGAVVNRWGRLVGLIATTSDGATTAERDLRAITLAHIDRSVREHTKRGLSDIIGPEAQEFANQFRTEALPALAQKLVDQIAH